MRAGALRHKVVVQRPRNEKQSGVVATTWEDFRECRASIEQMKSFDKQAAQSTMPGADVTVTIRYRPGIDATMRVLHGETVYSIIGQPNDVDGRHRELVLTCERGVKLQ